MFKSVLLFVAVTGLVASKDSSPVSKVIRLLNDMQGELIAEKKADEEMFDKMQCWCKKNGDGKGASVATAETNIANLENDIKGKTAKSSQLEMDIQNLDKEVAENMQALASGEKLRSQQAAQFHADDMDMSLSIDSLKNALVVMAKSQESSFMQTSATTVRMAVKKIVAKTGEDLMAQILAPEDRDVLSAFMQGGAQPGGAHAPASGEIMGMLKQMKENFEENLKDAKATEAKAAAEAADLKKGKTEEVESGEGLSKEKTAQLTKTRQELAQAKEDFEDTSASLAADQAFLKDMNERCGQSEGDHEERSKTRTLEITAVSEAINIISGEDSHDLFASTLSFIQMSSARRVMSKEDRARESVSHVLLRTAKKTGNKAFVQLAAKAKLGGAFKEIEDSINGMIADMKKEGEEEKTLKDFCRDSFHKNEMSTMDNENLIKDTETKIANFADNIELLTGEITVLKAEIEDMKVGLQQANINRVKENQEFQKTVADQRATQTILKRAVDKLAEFYEFVQTKSSVNQAPPAGPAEYKKNAKSGSVLVMIRGIIQDAADMEAEAIKSEQDSEDAYVEFLGNSFTSIDEASRAIVNKVEDKAEAEEDKVNSEADLKDAHATGAALVAENGELHQQCDFVVANYDARVSARTAEADGLKGALAALSTAGN